MKPHDRPTYDAVTESLRIAREFVDFPHHAPRGMYVPPDVCWICFMPLNEETQGDAPDICSKCEQEFPIKGSSNAIEV